MAPAGNRRVCCKGQVARNQQRAQRYMFKRQERENNAAALITKMIRKLIAKQKVTSALNRPYVLQWMNSSLSYDPQETNTIFVWQEDHRNVNLILETFDRWETEMSPESFQEILKRFVRDARRGRNDATVALVQLPAAQTFDIQQVTQDCSCYQRRLLCADVCGAHWQPDSEQVESQVESQDDLALAQSPVAQIFDSQQVTYDCCCHWCSFLCADACGTVWQVESQKPKATAATSTFMQRFRFPYKFVSAQLTSSKGDEIFYPVNDDQDRQWAMRLEWAIDCHRNIAEDDLEELHADHCAVIRQSKEAHERKYDRHYIADLVKRLEATNKSLRELNLYGLMK